MSYSRLVQSLPQLKGCLASGYPFVFGFTVYESFESQQVAQTGIVPMPAAGESCTRRSRGDRGGLRRQPKPLHRAQLLGHGLGHAGLLHHTLRLPDGTQSLSDFWTIRLVQS